MDADLKLNFLFIMEHQLIQIQSQNLSIYILSLS